MVTDHNSVDSEVIFKTKAEEKEIKYEGTLEDVTLRLDFLASTPCKDLRKWRGYRGRNEGRVEEIQF